MCPKDVFVNYRQFLQAEIEVSFRGLVVHHKNRKRSDNRLENLCLVTPAIHWAIHRKDWVSNEKLRRGREDLESLQRSADLDWIIWEPLKKLDLSLLV